MEDSGSNIMSTEKRSRRLSETEDSGSNITSTEKQSKRLPETEVSGSNITSTEEQQSKCLPETEVSGSNITSTEEQQSKCLSEMEVLVSDIKALVVVWSSWILLLYTIALERTDGKHVLTVDFEEWPNTRRAFKCILALACFGSYVALHFSISRPKFASFCRYLGATSMAAALAILVWVVVMCLFRET